MLGLKRSITGKADGWKEGRIWGRKNRGNFGQFEQFKRGGESRVHRLDSYNIFNV